MAELLHGFVKIDAIISQSYYRDLSKVIHGFLSIVKWICQKICLTIKIVWLLSLETSANIEPLSADWKHQLFTTLLPMLCDGHFLWQYVTNLQEYVKEFVTYHETYLDNGCYFVTIHETFVTVHKMLVVLAGWQLQPSFKICFICQTSLGSMTDFGKDLAQQGFLFKAWN